MSVWIGVAIAALGLIISFLAFQLNKSNFKLAEANFQLEKIKEVKTDTQESAELKAELGYIRKGVDDIRIDLKANEKQMAHLSERVTRVEESTKQAHKRIDQIESKEG